MSPSFSQGLLFDPAYPRLKDFLIRSTGLAYYGDKDADLANKIALRLVKQGLQDCGSYLSLLERGEAGATELDALIEDLTIGETFFFRHRELFDAIRDVVLPDCIERNGHNRQLRIWSAGCATGAEAYSLAILLKRELAAQVDGWDITIIGTDINREFLARARDGLFEDWALRTNAEDLKRSCFQQVGKSWLLKPEYRQPVSFQYHNLVTHPFPSLLNNLFAFDLVLCRNVTIYFSLEIVRHLIDHFHQSLVEGGWLLVGHAEPNLELFRSFRTVNAPGAVLYQKSKETAGLSPWLSPAPPSPASLPTLPGTGGNWPSFQTTWAPPVFLEKTVPSPVRQKREVPLPIPVSSPATTQPAFSELDKIRSLADAGELEEAASCCQKVLEKDKLNPTVHFFLALVLEQMGQHPEAENSLRRAIYLDRNHVLAHYYLGLLLQKKGQLSQAARSFRNVVQILERVDPGQVFVAGDGITAAELKKMTEMHLEVLKGA